jgi:hypothetical protein
VEAERRQVTVLFADMVDFTTFSERSDGSSLRDGVPTDLHLESDQKKDVNKRDEKITDSDCCGNGEPP